MTFEETYEFVQEFDEYVKGLDPLWQKIMIYWKKRNWHVLDLDRGWEMIGTGQEFCTDNWLFDFDISGILFDINQAGDHPESPGDSLYNMKKVKFNNSERSEYFAIKELYLNDLSPLRILPDLTYLDLENVYVKNSDALFELGKLKTLDITNSPIKNISRITQFKNLSTLLISNPYHGIDKDLWIQYNTDLKVLGKMNALKTLRLSGYWDTQMFEHISYISNLEDLSIQQPISAEELNFIGDIHSLQSLSLYFQQDVNLSQIIPDLIRKLPNIKTVIFTSKSMESYKVLVEQNSVYELELFDKMIDSRPTTSLINTFREEFCRF